MELSEQFNNIGQKLIDLNKLNRTKIIEIGERNPRLEIITQRIIGTHTFLCFFDFSQCKFHFHYYGWIIRSVIKSEAIPESEVDAILYDAAQSIVAQIIGNLQTKQLSLNLGV